ncbi:MAG: hypothetical protein EPN48_00405 [Microbacteriaceae bacterium]|nr:MAG: hypothetical protein EPN48_00405 [Microbacteriaceae bacterium]
MDVVMNDAQVWSIIGVLAATLVSTIIGFFTLFLRTMKAQFETVHVQLTGLRNEMDTRFDAVGARFDATDRRIDGIDRDIQLIFSKVFGTGRDRL